MPSSKIYVDEIINPNSQTATLTFSAVPDDGHFTIVVGDKETAAIEFDATASDVQVALRALGKNLSDALVTGDFNPDLTIVLADCSSEISIGENTLENTSTPVTIDISVAREYVLDLTAYANLSLEIVYGTNAGSLDLFLEGSASIDHFSEITNPVSRVTLDAGGGSHLYNISNVYFKYLKVNVPDMEELSVRLQGIRFGIN